jgi:hypothetical protein
VTIGDQLARVQYAEIYSLVGLNRESMTELCLLDYLPPMLHDPIGLFSTIDRSQHILSFSMGEVLLGPEIVSSSACG